MSEGFETRLEALPCEGSAFVNCDCMEGMKRIADKSIDMILCDPPYGTTQNKWDSVIPLDFMWEQWKRVIKAGGVIAVFTQMPFTVDVVQSNKKWFRYEWIWEKSEGTGFLNANKMPLKIHENILIFYDSLGTYNPQKRQGFRPGVRKNIPASNSENYGKFSGHSWISDGTRFPIDIIRFSNSVRRENINQTQKPVNLLEYLILTYTNEGEIVLDPTAGSGSALVASHKARRNFIGFEKDAGMYQKATERLRAEMAQMSIFDFMEDAKEG